MTQTGVVGFKRTPNGIGITYSPDPVPTLGGVRIPKSAFDAVQHGVELSWDAGEYEDEEDLWDDDDDWDDEEEEDDDWDDEEEEEEDEEDDWDDEEEEDDDWDYDSEDEEDDD